MTGGTFPGQVSVSPGGVGRNLAECLVRLGPEPLFITSAGQDSFGRLLADGLPPSMDLRGCRTLSDCQTARCNVILNKRKECLFCVGDFRAHYHVSTQWISKFTKDIEQAPLVVFDANIPIDSMKLIISLCKKNGVPTWFEPTDGNKAGKLFRSQDQAWRDLTYASPNLKELSVMVQAAQGDAEGRELEAVRRNSDLVGLARLCQPLMRSLQTLVITMGSDGVLLLTRNKDRFPVKGHIHVHPDQARAFHYPVFDGYVQQMVSVSGAGDCLAGAMIASILRGLDRDSVVQAGLRAARLSLASDHCVPETICPENVFLVESGAAVASEIDY